MEKNLTTSQIAKRLNVSPITVRLWCRQGKFPKAYEDETPRGMVWLIPESDLENFEPPKTGRPLKAKSKD